ncbi:Hypothetical protein NTJ_07805 [Nesidiocoris tenuis]|uniref:Uncharacterized protein n=1 Tax=Nesidiocoris tenuis TaxID=355587 RepID=A0ABN7AVN9_9HEMI|nr:Hypothetical protein NTJ_07805 [Nesidiocoris tenuis]
MRIFFMCAVLLVAAITLAETQVVFRPHFVYKQKQAEKAAKENKRRQEVIYQQSTSSQPEYYDPYYYYYYQTQSQQPQYNSNYYRPFEYQQRSRKEKRSPKLCRLLKKYQMPSTAEQQLN